MKFSRYLKTHRLAAKLSHEALAQRARISPAYVSRIEGGSRSSPSDEILARLAKALGLNPDDVYRAAGSIPPDVVAIMLKDPASFARVRSS